MPCRPRRPEAPQLPKSIVSLTPPDDLSAAQKQLWPILARQVNLAGTYNDAMESAFRMLVKVCAGAMALDLSGGADNADTRLLTQAATWLGKFGLTPADAVRVKGLPSTGWSEDDEFGPPQLRVIGAAPKPWEQK
jgi:hypothetical protein